MAERRQSCSRRYYVSTFRGFGVGARFAVLPAWDDDWRATGARRSVPGVDEFAVHRAAIDGFLKRAQSLRLEERVGLRVAIERQRKEGLAVSVSVPNLREGARRLAELIIAQLREAERSVEPAEIQELEALVWKRLPNR